MLDLATIFRIYVSSSSSILVIFAYILRHKRKDEAAALWKKTKLAFAYLRSKEETYEN
jgi:hypothetical protein